MASGGLPNATSTISPTSEDSNMSNDNSSGDNDTCLQLALEGEKLCKAGNCRDGVAFFEAALQAGTDDFRTLSAIYSQLGNAYFYMGDYVKAMQYHKHDLTLARTMADRLGEAKASGNLGNTLKVMGKFEEAVICCRRHLEICQDHRDRVGEGRALYNLGNVYHAKGKHIGRLGHQDPGEFPEEVKALFEKAVQYYEDNMMLMVEIGDRAAQGRACGNLGNVHYLLGNFSRAIHFHQERLKIAKEFSDKAAERRAHSNLGNAHIFLGEFEKAADHYKKTLHLAQELGDRAVEAQACYSLGNTYTLLKDYPMAVEYHLRHLTIAQELFDKVGEGRACWSLGNAHAAMGQHQEAYHYAAKHLQISKDTGDRMGQATAQLNLAELSKTLGYPEDGPPPPPMSSDQNDSRKNTASTANNQARRKSMEQMDLLKMTPDASKAKASKSGASENLNKSGLLDEEDFFDFISRFQSKRMDDQRCSLAVPPLSKPSMSSQSIQNSSSSQSATKPNPTHPFNSQQKVASAHLQPSNPVVGGPLQINSSGTTQSGPFKQQKDELLDLIAGVQSHRMNEQRAAVPFLPGLTRSSKQPPELLQRLSVATNNEENFPDESFFEMLMKCQGSRIEEQRTSLPNGADLHDPPLLHARNAAGNNLNKGNSADQPASVPLPPHAPTVPDEDFFSLIQRLQGGRLEDQRAVLPTENTRNGNAAVPADKDVK